MESKPHKTFFSKKYIELQKVSQQSLQNSTSNSKGEQGLLSLGELGLSEKINDANPGQAHGRFVLKKKAVSRDGNMKGIKAVEKSEEPVNEISGIDLKSGIAQSRSSRPRVPVAKPKPKANDLRQAEVNQLKIKFSTSGKFSKEIGPDDEFILSFYLPITDPDFPFDLEHVDLAVTLPRNYPLDSPIFSIRNANIPDDLKAKIESRLNSIVKTLPPGEPSVRPMLRYLENNLESIVTAKSSIKFIPSSSIKVSEGSIREGPVVEGALLNPSPALSPILKSDAIEFISLKLRETRFESGQFIKLSDPPHLGAGSFQMHCVWPDPSFSNASIAVCTSCSITVTCSKCSFANDFREIRPESERLTNCQKCKRQLSCAYFPEYVHQNNDRLGQIKLVHCRPLDMLPSQWQLECPHCSLTVRVNSVQFGEPIRHPCISCHTVIFMQLDGVKWTEIIVASDMSKKQRQEKLAVTVGEPLPRYGACDHYTKSYRWYRFPCCGRVYPCDRCHDESVKSALSSSHTMELATRFICGFCSREQHVNNVKKVCVCGNDPQRSRTAHWEGGKGLRDQTTMSRKDNKKYRGLNKY